MQTCTQGWLFGTPRHSPAPAASREQTNPAFAQADGQMPNRLCVPWTSGSLQGEGLSKSHGGSGERHLLPILKLGVGENLYSQMNSLCAPRNIKGRATISSQHRAGSCCGLTAFLSKAQRKVTLGTSRQESRMSPGTAGIAEGGETYVHSNKRPSSPANTYHFQPCS